MLDRVKRLKLNFFKNGGLYNRENRRPEIHGGRILLKRLFIVGMILLGSFLCVAAYAAKDTYAVRVASNVQEQVAKQFQRQLQMDGYGPIRVVQKNGMFSVLVGTFQSEKEAQSLMQDLKSSGGYPVESVVSTADEGGGSSKTVSTAESGVMYRVEVTNPLNDQKLADDAKKDLLANDYVGVEAVLEDGKYHLYVGSFPAQDDAEKVQKMLVRDGYATAKVVKKQTGNAGGTTPQPPAGPQPTDINSVQIPADIAKSLLGSEEEKLAKEALFYGQKVKQGFGGEWLDKYRATMGKIRPEIRKLITDAVDKPPSTDQPSGSASPRRKKDEIDALYPEINTAVTAHAFDNARKVLEKIKKIDPTEPRISIKEDYINAMEKIWNESQTPVKKMEEKLTEASKLMADRSSRASLEKALECAREAQRLKPDDPRPRAVIEDVQNLLGESGPRPPGGTDNRMLLIGGIVLFVLILLFITYMLIQNTRKERELIRQVQELASHSSMETKPVVPLASEAAAKQKPATGPKKKPGVAPGKGLAGSPLFTGAMMVGSSADEDDVSEEQEQVVAQAGGGGVIEGLRHETRPPGEADVVFIGNVHESPKQGTASASGDLSLSDLNIGLPGEEEFSPFESSKPEPAPSGPALPDIDLDSLLKSGLFSDKPAEHKTAKIEDIAPAPAISSTGIELDKVDGLETAPPGLTLPDDLELPGLGSSIETSPAVTSTPSVPGIDLGLPPIEGLDIGLSTPTASDPPAPVAAASSNGMLFAQTFDEEAVGKQPKGWQGEYDYASLTVDDQTVSNGSSRSLRFEKRSGAGSANYVCQFPKASGHVIVEFDIRCDDKNKYLLGFYVEKDEDFKQSVHTIIHRTDSKSQPSLRIQGEPIPYDLGSWKRIKYDLNLLAGIVNAYVDGQQVVKDGKLPTNPAYVNTLSIRDNLATTGILYLDNIKIYKA